MGNKKRENLKQRLEVPSVRLKNSLALGKKRQNCNLLYVQAKVGILFHTRKKIREVLSGFNIFSNTMQIFVIDGLQMNSSSQKIEKNNRDISKIHFNIKTKTTELIDYQKYIYPLNYLHVSKKLLTRKEIFTYT